MRTTARLRVPNARMAGGRTGTGEPAHRKIATELDLMGLKSRARGSRGQCSVALLPFPSSPEGSYNRQMGGYYSSYSKKYASLFPEYYVPKSGYWELPSWAAYVSGFLGKLGVEHALLDMSHDNYYELKRNARRVAPDGVIFSSPLAQNYPLCVALDVNGGVVRGGVTTHQAYCQFTDYTRVRLDRYAEPDYGILRSYFGDKSPPLLRIGSSYGCPFSCSFCTLRDLPVVARSPCDIEHTLREYSKYWGGSRVFYIDDKTLGQAPKSHKLLARFLGRYFPEHTCVAQTHHSMIKERTVPLLRELNVSVVELGVETLDTTALIRYNKANIRCVGAKRYLRQLDRAIGILKAENVVMIGNLIAGLSIDGSKTLSFMERHRDDFFLWNVYMLAEYPEATGTPPLDDDYEAIREDIATQGWKNGQLRALLTKAAEII